MVILRIYGDDDLNANYYGIKPNKKSFIIILRYLRIVKLIILLFGLLFVFLDNHFASLYTINCICKISNDILKIYNIIFLIL